MGGQEAHLISTGWPERISVGLTFKLMRGQNPKTARVKKATRINKDSQGPINGRTDSLPITVRGG